MKKKAQKIAKFKMLSFCQKIIFMVSNIAHANVQFLGIVYTNFQNFPETNVGGVEFSIQALS